jgi:putative DNA methylase
LAVAVAKPAEAGKMYRLPTRDEFQCFERAKADCLEEQENKRDGIFSIPREELNHLRGFFNVVLYGMRSWGDLFYVWLRRMLKDVHPQLLKESLSPKDDEAVTLAHRAAMYRHKNREFFEKMMTLATAEGRRYTKPDGIGVIVFANKSTSGWEAMLTALIDSGWIISASWPIDTEMSSRLRAQDSAVLAFSVHLVCRPRENPDGSLRTDAIGDWRDVLTELPRRIHDWMPRLADEGIVGADAIFACLGPALEIFSRYSRVEKASGEAVTLREYLEQVWAAVAKEALTMIFAGADATGFEEDARLTAMWLWTLHPGNGNGKVKDDAAQEEEPEDEEEGRGSKGKKAKAGYALEYDAARKIAQGLGAHLEKLAGVVEVKGDTARLLSVSERTKALFGNPPAGRQGDQASAPTGRRKKKDKQMKMGFMAEVEAPGEEVGMGLPAGRQGEKSVSTAGNTVLDRVHQAMILFAAGRSEALRRFLVEDGAGRDQRFWRLAQALSALYPSGTDEKRSVDGVLGRKKGLGL